MCVSASNFSYARFFVALGILRHEHYEYIIPMKGVYVVNNCSDTAADDDEQDDDETLLEDLGLPPLPPRPTARPTPALLADNLSFAPATPPERASVVADAAPPSVPADDMAPAGEAASDWIPNPVSNPNWMPASAASAIYPVRTDQYDGREQTYDDFRRLLGLPPSVGGAPVAIPLPPIDGMAAASGAMIMDAKRRRDEAAQLQAVLPVPHSPTTQPARASVAKENDDDDDDDLDGIEALEIAPGSTRDVTKSPQHHKLQLDSWIPNADEDEEDEGDGDEEEEEEEVGKEEEDGGKAHVAAHEAPPEGAADAGAAASAGEGADPSTGTARMPGTARVLLRSVDPRGSHAAAAAFAAADDAVSEEEGEWALETTPMALETTPRALETTPSATRVAPAEAAHGSSSVGALTAQASAPSSPESAESNEWLKVPPHPTGCDPRAEASAEAVARATRPVLPSFAVEPAEDADEEAVMPFQLDPDFDYDAPVPNTERFSVARALVEGEFYDREPQASR